jgi:parallel beta-helix repeat protein
MSYSIDAPAMRESSRPNRMLMPLCLAAAAFLLFAPEARAQVTASQNASASSGTVNVVPPTGEIEADRDSILAALKAIRPGGTVQFAPGTYLVGELIRVTISDVTVGSGFEDLQPINAPKADLEVFGSAEVDEQEGMLEGNLIEGNTVSGAEGIGIELLHASGNRIVNNTITGIASRDPFPGIIVNSFDPQKSGWREANGSGIWVSPGSDENVVGAADSVRDLGSSNRVSGPAGAREPTADPPPSGILEAGRLVFHQLLHPVGEETYTLARDGDAYVLHADFSHNDRGQSTERSVALHLNSPGAVTLGNRQQRVHGRAGADA